MLPIEPVLPQLWAALEERGLAVLQAPPGAGKTTRVPLCLMERGQPGRILMLEPRRIAARAAAERLAAALGEAPGASVGWRIRGESVPGARVEVVTEGVLTRMIQSDPELAGVGCVIFDEFHERALAADLGLALALEIRGALRPDLRLLVMSATLDAGPVAALMGGAPLVTAEGRAHPVETVWLDRPWARPGGPRFEAAAADLVVEALAATEGGVLVFLPGQAEIARVEGLLARRLPGEVAIQPLHGGLSFERQRAALAPLARGRKLVLATSIAETSLTIPDVRAVVDAGRARRARFDPGSGMSRLATERVSRAEAEQRRGRAGRVGPGWCFRLWTRGEEGALPAFAPPEIATADLAGLALELAVWGAAAGDLAFLTPPPAPALAEARALLVDLGALEDTGRVTAHGRRLAGLPLHPRLGHMLCAAAERGAGETTAGTAGPDTAAGIAALATAAGIAALAQARDPVRGEAGRAPVDLALRLAALRDPGRVEAEHPVRVDRALLAAIRAEAARLRRLARGARSGAANGPPGGSAAGASGVSATRSAGGLAGTSAAAPAGLSAGGAASLAWPDRIGRRRPGDAPRFLLSGGKGAVLPEGDRLAGAPLIVAVETDGDPREALVRLALPVTEGEIRALHADRLRVERACRWSRRERSVQARERLTLGAVAFEDRPWRDAPPAALTAAMAQGVRDLGLASLPWTPALRRLQSRADWLRAQGEDLADVSDDGLAAALEDWLAPWLAGVTRADQLGGVDLRGALEARLGPGRARLDRLAPAEIAAPTGTRLPIDYGAAAPRISVRLQEMFGLTDHPTVGPRRIPLVVELLSPGRRPVQITSDLPGFWANAYAQVRRDLRGRYPRHPWPEDPAAAEPTRRAKPRG